MKVGRLEDGERIKGQKVTRLTVHLPFTARLKLLFGTGDVLVFFKGRPLGLQIEEVRVA